MARQSEKEFQDQKGLMEKDYTDPPPAPFFDFEEFGQWSLYLALIAEFVAAFLFLFIIVSAIIGHKKNSEPCGSIGLLGIAWAVGGMIFVLVYCTAGISGDRKVHITYMAVCFEFYYEIS